MRCPLIFHSWSALHSIPFLNVMSLHDIANHVSSQSHLYKCDVNSYPNFNYRRQISTIEEKFQLSKLWEFKQDNNTMETSWKNRQCLRWRYNKCQTSTKSVCKIFVKRRWTQTWVLSRLWWWNSYVIRGEHSAAN